jgi:hypothetical protein
MQLMRLILYGAARLSCVTSEHLPQGRGTESSNSWWRAPGVVRYNITALRQQPEWYATTLLHFDCQRATAGCVPLLVTF